MLCNNKLAREDLMRVYEFSVKFEQYGRFSDAEQDFKGFFICENGTSVFTGVSREQYSTPYDKLRFVKGIYRRERGQLFFVKVLNLEVLNPLCYVFQNVEKAGFWALAVEGIAKSSEYRQGSALIKVCQIPKPDKKLIQKTKNRYQQVFNRISPYNKTLLEEVREGMKLPG